MKDYFNNDIQIGDTCIINRFNEFVNGRIIDSDDYQGGRVKIRISDEYECDLTIQLSSDIIDITALGKI